MSRGKQGEWFSHPVSFLAQCWQRCATVLLVQCSLLVAASSCAMEPFRAMAPKTFGGSCGTDTGISQPGCQFFCRAMECRGTIAVSSHGDTAEDSHSEDNTVGVSTALQ